ncbi:MAG: hypothetical protein AAB492_05665 [Patescibacteria group bacterium]
MMVEKLRERHPRLVYTSYKMAQTGNELVVVYTYLLEPDSTFESTYRFPCPSKIELSLVEPFLFQLGMVEAISYWKLACPQELLVQAGALTTTDISFFKSLFLHGLGEFYYVNTIDFTIDNFFAIRSTKSGENSPVEISTKAIDLVLVGGGKDSALLLSLLTKSHRSIKPLVINPSLAAEKTIQALGLDSPLVVTRTIDPKLIKLNGQGYLNGHTPFSALLSFVGVTVAALFGYENVIVANEQSANEGNVVYKGVEVNHQYSKSLRYENLFREHLQETLTPSIAYFSAMRAFNDVQIAKMFSFETALLPIFRSCNRSRTINEWCGECAKCAFTYLTLFPFVPYEKIITIFGRDYFSNPLILGFIRELVGIIPVKPFECVGTSDEAKLALLLSIGSYKRFGREVPEGLLLIKTEVCLVEQDVGELSTRVLDHIYDNHNLPDEHATLMMAAWKRSQRRHKKV